jgi:hypothetical protein
MILSISSNYFNLSVSESSPMSSQNAPTSTFWSQLDTFSIVACAISLSLLVGYHLYFALRHHFVDGKSPTTLRTMLTIDMRWSLKHCQLTDAASCTLAVQTVRNIMQAGVWLGGSVFVGAYTVLQTFPSLTDPFIAIRCGALGTTLLFCFLNFALVIRFASHSSLLIGSIMPANTAVVGDVQVPDFDDVTKRALAIRFMHRMSLHWYLGFRAAYVSIPIALMILGPTMLIVSSVLILLVFQYMDTPGVTTAEEAKNSLIELGAIRQESMV